MESAAANVDRRQFIGRWERQLGPTEAQRLLTPRAAAETGTAVPRVEPLPPPEPQRTPICPAEEDAAPDTDEDREEVLGPRTAPEAVEPQPSVWVEHVKPLLLANWYLLAGLLFVVVGASLLAYFTWDKHWVWRLTVMPAVLGLFTFGLAELGNLLQRRHGHLKGTGAAFAGGAIGLLPLNFMTLCMLSRDTGVPARPLLVLTLGAVYLAVFGWGVRRWIGFVCAAVRDSLALPLIALNAIVMLVAFAASTALEPASCRFLLPVCFYVGAILLFVATRFFCRTALTPELLTEKRVPWFFGATLAVTYAQVFAWSHLFLGLLPLPTVYAVLTVAFGGEVLYWERCALRLQVEDGASAAPIYVGESFLGFAAILGGILMGMTHPTARVLTLLLAGVIWVLQAERRTGLLHYRIGLTLVLLSGASVALFDWFPKGAELNLIPALGLCLASALTLTPILARKLGNARLSATAEHTQPSLLLLVAVVSVLSQWRIGSNPLGTGIVLVAVSGFLIARGVAQQAVDWLHAGMGMLAVALPYLGCMDLAHRELRGNAMAFGLGILSLLWLAALRYAGQPLLRRARSSVLFSYGALATASVLVRVLFERQMEGTVLDAVGVLLTGALLLLTGVYTRSLLPTVLAVITIVVLLPALQTPLTTSLGTLATGSGLANALSGLALILLCLELRQRLKFSPETEPDLSLDSAPFPCQRSDHRLFTLPLSCGAAFLAAKACAWKAPLLFLRAAGSASAACALLTCATVWALFSLLLREHAVSRLTGHLSWVCLLLSAVTLHHMPGHPLSWPGALLSAGLLLQFVYVLYSALALRFGVDWIRPLLRQPVAHALRYGSLLVACCLVAAVTATSRVLPSIWLIAFTIAQLVWHGLGSRKYRYGAALYALAAAALLASLALPERVSLLQFGPDLPLMPLLLFMTMVQIAAIVLERHESLASRLLPLSTPLRLGNLIAAVLLAVLVGFSLTRTSQAGMAVPVDLLALFAVLLLAVRAESAGFLLLLAVCIGYVTTSPFAATATLGAPWRVGLLAALLCVLPCLGRLLHKRYPMLLAGATPLTPRGQHESYWLLVPGLAVCLVAAVAQLLLSALGMDPASDSTQLVAPFAAVLCYALAGFHCRQPRLLVAAGALLAAANVHAVALVAPRWLSGRGLSASHFVCLGLILTACEFTVLGWLPSLEQSRERLRRGSLLLAGLVLGLLAINYVAHPDVTRIRAASFLVSGLLASSAGLYFRIGARRAARDRARADRLEMLYHISLTTAIWCFLLIIPWLRHAPVILAALGVAPAVFWLRAEWGMHQTSPVAHKAAGRFRTTASVLTCVLLALYASRLACQMVLFPSSQLLYSHYHLSAPAALLLSLLLFRLHALGGGLSLAFYGGVGVITGLYFATTAYPSLSPFVCPVPAAWAAVFSAHLLIVASYRLSPVRRSIQRLSRLDAAAWDTLRRGWGRYVLITTQGLVVFALLRDVHSVSLQATPLLAAAATVWIHQGMVKGARWYHVVAGVELFAALHADFVLPGSSPGLIPAADVVWILLALWTLALVTQNVLDRWLNATANKLLSASFCVVVALHLWFHRPWSAPGLGIALGMALLAALTPVATRTPTTQGERRAACLLLLAPVWLTYFGQVYRVGGDFLGLQPVLSVLAVALALGAAGRYLQRSGKALRRRLPGEPCRLYRHALAVLVQQGTSWYRAALWFTFLVEALLLFSPAATQADPGPLLWYAALWGLTAWGWFVEGRDRDSLLANVLGELCPVGMYTVIRRLFGLSYEHDVWVCLAVSCCLAGAKPAIGRQRAQLRVPLLGGLFVLPALALTSVAIHGWSTDMALIVLALHSVIFVYMGAGDRRSPFSAAAIFGFVAFVLLLFWSQLQLRFVHAYVIPTGIGTLALLQLFGRELRPQTRNSVRLAVLLAMLGSSGYYAIVGRGPELGFQLTMILLCLGAMALGGFLRIKLYVLLGFTGIVVDLAALCYRIGVEMERTQRMVSVGASLLAIGVALVGGSAYYKANQERLRAYIDDWRGRLSHWE